MNIYAIGGLGADERVFSKLNLDQEIIFIPWLVPYQEESIITYSQRLIRGYTITDRDILIGVSFGGLIAQHTSQFVKPKAIILISSFTMKTEIHEHWRLLLASKLYKTLTQNLLNSYQPFLGYLFSVHNPDNKKLLADIIHDSHPTIARWALGQIDNFTPVEPQIGYYKINGTTDRLIKYDHKEATPPMVGGHFMIIEQALELSAILNYIIKRHPEI